MWKKYKKESAALLLLILVISILLLRRQIKPCIVNIHSIVHYVHNYGKLSILVFLLAYLIKPLAIVLPSTILTIAGGILFGPIRGFLLNLVGYFLSATLAFYLGKTLGKPFVDKVVKGKVENLSDLIDKNGFKLVFFFRLIPVMPYDLLSYAAGLTNISYFHFMVGTICGIIPETLCYSFLGRGLNGRLSLKLFLPLFIIILITVFGTNYLKKRYKIDKEI